MDMGTYDLGGRRIAAGDIWANVEHREGHAAFYMYFLGLVYRVAGHNIPLVWVAQFGLGSAGAVLLFLAVRQLTNKETALIAGLLFAANSIVIYYEGTLLRESFGLFFLLLSFYLFVTATHPPQSGLIGNAAKRQNVFFALGFAALSAAVQTRPNYALILPLLLAHLFCGPLENLPVTRRFAKLGGYALLFFGLMTPMLYRGYVVYGRWFFLDSHGPFLLLYGNLPQYPGYGFGPYPRFDEYMKIYGQNISLGEVLRLLWENFAAGPAGFARMYAIKIFAFLNNHEMGQNLGFYAFQDFSPVLRNPASLAGFSLGIALTGMRPSRREWKRHALCYAYLLGLFLGMVLFIPLGRYRYVMLPWIVFFEAYGLWSIYLLCREKRLIKASGLAMLALVAAWSLRAPDYVSARSCVDSLNMGFAFLNEPRTFNLQQAEKYGIQCWNAEKTLDLDHKNGGQLLAKVYDMRATSLFEHSELEQAGKMATASFEVQPNHAYPFKLRAIIHLSRNQADQAMLALLQAIFVEPMNKELYEILANLYHKNTGNDFKLYVALTRWLTVEKDSPRAEALRAELKSLEQKNREATSAANPAPGETRKLFLEEKWEAALPQYEQLNRYNAVDDSLPLELGVIYGSLNRFQDALLALYTGLLINPGNRDIHKILADYYWHNDKNGFMAILHLKAYLRQTEESGEFVERKHLYAHLRRTYAAQNRSPLIPSAS